MKCDWLWNLHRTCSNVLYHFTFHSYFSFLSPLYNILERFLLLWENTTTKSRLERKGFISSCSSRSSLREVRAGTETSHGGMQLPGLLLVAYITCFLVWQQHLPRGGSTSVSWAHTRSVLIKRYTTDLPTGRHYGGALLTENSSSQNSGFFSSWRKYQPKHRSFMDCCLNEFALHS